MADTALSVTRDPRPGRAIPSPFGVRTIVLALIVLALLGVTGKRVQVDRLGAESVQAAAYLAGAADRSLVVETIAGFGAKLFPIQVSRTTPVDRIPGFDAARLPWFSHVETRSTTVQRLDPATLKMRGETVTERVLVEEYGYVLDVAGKTFETLEIGLWATILSVLLSFPLSLLAASTVTPHGAVRWAVRALFGMFRAVPELISALFMVLVFGFGPVAGVLALGLHGVGFLGKFYAEDIENAPAGPQEALRAIGARRGQVFGYAILPQVMPQFLAYTIYLLDRNFRMATMIGLVGAGGIGQELKGRYDLYEYHHVATIMIAILVSVLLLEILSSRVRKRFL
ncbi:MAG: phosphonate ABC transporter, permease protein PhnE [Pseudomonadota bacterium]